MDDLLADFIEETRELLEASESEIIAWEADPGDRSHLDAIFRFVHTVKGNCGFFDFPRLEQLSHAAEDALAEVRNGRRDPDARLVTAVLAVMDRIAEMVDAIEAGKEFPGKDDSDLIAALDEDFSATGVTEIDISAETDDQQTENIPAAANRSIRLPVELLDRVMSGVSDIVLARNDLAHRLRESGTQPTIDGPFERLTTILADVRDAVTRMRMQRIEHLFGAFPRLVRDLSQELGKQVMIDLDGGDVELDREMIEMIRDPMTHIIRNAIDHGIESPDVRLKAGKHDIGIISLAARQSGNTISITVSDDGAGLKEDRIAEKALAHGLVTKGDFKQMSREDILQLVFSPGLSTAEQVSSVSGRGVGLDVVRANLEKVGGSIQVSSTPGAGTEFTLQIPLTLSIIAGLTLEVGGERFAVPQGYVEEIVHGSAADLDLSEVGETSLITFRGERTPCLSLADVLGLDSNANSESKVMVMVRPARGGLFALAVDAIHNHGDLVVKPLAPAVMRSGLFNGSTLLDDGSPILMLDIPNIAAQNNLVSDSREKFARIRTSEQQVAPPEAERAMLFRDFHGNRRAIRLGLVRRIETIASKAVDCSGSSLRAVVDGEILPLVGIESMMSVDDQLRMLRLSDGSCELLYAVAKIEDAVALENELVPVKDDPMTEAVTLVGDKTVALVDGHALFASHGAIPKRVSSKTCYVPEGDWAQSILAPLVKAAGYEPVNGTPDGADIAIIIDEQDAPINAASIIHLRSQPDPVESGNSSAGSIYRYDRDGVLHALRQAGRGEAA